MKKNQQKQHFDILYLDNHLLVVNKPAGILAQGDITGDADLLTLSKTYLKQRFHKPGNVFLGLVHRLDRMVSGVTVFARTSKAAARLSAQFRDHTVEKKYMAIVEGRLQGAGACRDYILKGDRKSQIVTPKTPGAQYAQLLWNVLEQKTSVTLLEITLVTGRHHQIRAQLSGMGNPVLGDRKYGSKENFYQKNIGLHCFLLSLEHPVRKETLTWKAPLPVFWRKYVQSAV